MKCSLTVLSIVSLLATIAIGLAGCGGATSSTQPGFGQVVLRIVVPTNSQGVAVQNATEMIEEVRVRISGSEMEELNLTLPYDPETKEATGTIKVPQGIDRLFEITAIDANEKVLFEGQEIADVTTGETVSITIHLWPTAREGAAKIDVEIDNPDPGLGQMIYGLCYGPFRDGQSPTSGIFPSQSEIEEDMAILSGRVGHIRIFSFHLSFHH